MRIVDEKLEKFANDIMTDVANRRREILSGVDKAIQEEYDNKEIEYYVTAYDYIQEGLKDIDREKNEIISQAVLKNKTNLLNERVRIITEIFENARNELREYTKKEGYKEYLLKMIEEDLAIIGKGDIEIIINKSDESFLDELKNRFNLSIKVERKSVDFIGGCKLFNKNTNTFLDDSFESKLMDQKDGFLQKCHLEIE